MNVREAGEVVAGQTIMIPLFEYRRLTFKRKMHPPLGREYMHPDYKPDEWVCNHSGCSTDFCWAETGETP